MAHRPRRRPQECKKRFAKRCFFCPVADYDLLAAHRVLHGAAGGGYDWHNIMVLCSLCHGRVHAGIIQIIGRHFDSLGVRVIHCVVGGQDMWLRDGRDPVIACDGSLM